MKILSASVDHPNPRKIILVIETLVVNGQEVNKIEIPLQNEIKGGELVSITIPNVCVDFAVVNNVKPLD